MTLDWDAPAECPTRADVLAELSRITRVRADRVVTPIRARAHIERTGTKYRLQLRTEREDQTGDTDLDAPDCAVLKRGVTLVLALALGDGVDLVDEKPDDAPPVPKEPTPKTAPSSPPPARRPTRLVPAPIQPEKSPLQLVPALSGGASSGLLGSAAFGAQLSLAGQTRRFAVLAEVPFWPTQTAARVEGVSAQLFALSGVLGGCARQPLGALAWLGCARVTAGLIHARSAGAYRDDASTAPYYAVGPALVLVAPLGGPVALRVEAALDVSIAPPRFEERDFGTLDAVSRLVPSLSLGLAWAPPR